jgi:hypothetical protein
MPNEKLITTTEEAESRLKKDFAKFGLGEDGILLDKDRLRISNVKPIPVDKEEEVKNDPLDAFKEYKEEDDEPQEHQEHQEHKEVVQAKDPDLEDALKKINLLVEKLDKQERQANERANMEYEAQRRQLIANGDYDAVLALERERGAQPMQVEVPKIDQAIQDFKRDNPWYGGSSQQDIKMTARANSYDDMLAKKNLSAAQAMEYLTQYMHDDFPDYFNKNKKAQQVEGNVNAGIVKNMKRNYNVENLQGEARFIAKEFERLKIMKADKYVEALTKTGLLK